MNRSQYTTFVHELLFTVACHEKVGMEFQVWFENIMERHDPSFIRIKPMGKHGDWKADGFSQATGVVYQCYAPENLTAIKAVAKIKGDFGGAKRYWRRQMKGWTLVYSSHRALPAPVVSMLNTLSTTNPRICIDHWGKHKLWQIVQTLPEDERNAILGHVPAVELAAEVTAAEVQTLLNFLIRQGQQEVSDSLMLTDLQDKLDRNNLGPAVRAVVGAALPVSRVVADYTRRHPDLEFSFIVARSLAAKYSALTDEDEGDQDRIFMELVTFVSQGHKRYFWAAAGIVTHYFELCEVFER